MSYWAKNAELALCLLNGMVTVTNPFLTESFSYSYSALIKAVAVDN